MPSTVCPETNIKGLYTATSVDGIHWEQTTKAGYPVVVGAYGYPGSQPPFVSQNASEVPSDSKGDWDTELSESDGANST